MMVPNWQPSCHVGIPMATGPRDHGQPANATQRAPLAFSDSQCESYSAESDNEYSYDDKFSQAESDLPTQKTPIVSEQTENDDILLERAKVQFSASSVQCDASGDQMNEPTRHTQDEEEPQAENARLRPQSPRPMQKMAQPLDLIPGDDDDVDWTRGGADSSGDDN